MSVMRQSQAMKDWYARGQRTGGQLAVPRTPVEKIMLRAKLLRLKRDFEARNAAR